MAVVYRWCDGENLNDPQAPGALPREHPASAFSRFRARPVPEILAAVDRIIDAHVAVARQGFVAADFYDGAVLYDFTHRRIHLCDLDAYRAGPYILDADRQLGSRRFMAPEEFCRGARTDERTTVYTLGRTAFVFLSRGPRGEDDPARWRAPAPLYSVAHRATAQDPDQRFSTVADFAHAWRGEAAERPHAQASHPRNRRCSPST